MAPATMGEAGLPSCGLRRYSPEAGHASRDLQLHQAPAREQQGKAGCRDRRHRTTRRAELTAHDCAGAVNRCPRVPKGDKASAAGASCRALAREKH